MKHLKIGVFMKKIIMAILALSTVNTFAIGYVHEIVSFDEMYILSCGNLSGKGHQGHKYKKCLRAYETKAASTPKALTMNVHFGVDCSSWNGGDTNGSVKMLNNTFKSLGMVSGYFDLPDSEYEENQTDKSLTVELDGKTRLDSLKFEITGNSCSKVEVKFDLEL